MLHNGNLYAIYKGSIAKMSIRSYTRADGVRENRFRLLLDQIVTSIVVLEKNLSSVKAQSRSIMGIYLVIYGKNYYYSSMV